MAIKELGALRAKLLLESRQFKEGMNDARNEMKRTGFSAIEASRDLKRIQIAALAVGSAVVAGIGASVGVAANFEQAMARVKAVSGATEEEFGRLEATAKQLGATTQFSSAQAAEGMNYLAMAGFKTNEIIGAMPSVLNLAAAAQIDLGRSSDIVSNIMTGFGLTAEETGTAVDVLVKTMTTANTDLPQLGEAMKYVAPVASSLGLGIEETAAAIAKMSDAGIQGSQAGTSLRAALLSLANPTGQTSDAIERLNIKVTDSEGKMKPLPELIGHIAEKLEGMTDTQKTATAAQLVGTEAASGFVSLLKVGEDSLRDYTKELENSGGTAERVAKTQMDTLIGAFKEFQSAAEALGIEVGEELLPLFTEAVKEGTGLVRMITEMDSSTVSAGIAFAGTAASIGIVITTVGRLAIALKGLMLAMGPTGWIITGLSIVGGLIAGYNVKQAEANKVSLENVEVLDKQRVALSGNIEEYERLKAKSKLSNDELSRFVDINSLLSKTADPEAIATFRSEQEHLREKSNLSNEELQRMIDLNGKIIETVPESNTVLTDQGNILLDNTSAAKQYNAEQLEMVRLELEAQKANLDSQKQKNLQKEKELLEEIKGLKSEMVSFDREEASIRKNIGELEGKLAEAKAKKDQGIIAIIQNKLNIERDNLQKLKEQNAESANQLLTKSKELKSIQEQLGMLDQVTQRMVAIELQQAGINAKKGEEMKILDSELTNLYKQRRELEGVNDVNIRNSAEYRQQKDEINKKIGQLEGVRGKILGIIGEADVLNSRLGADVEKRVFIREIGARNYSQARRAAEALGVDTNRHQGGTLPKLHIGGIPSQLQNPPSHHEIDVRLLRNEMVLTEAQQANLFRWIDAGQLSQSGTGIDQEQLLSILQIIASNTGRQLDLSVIMSDEKVGEIVEPIVTKIQNSNKTESGRWEGDDYLL